MVTDAWHPQINGIVSTLSALGRSLAGCGHTVGWITTSVTLYRPVVRHGASGLNGCRFWVTDPRPVAVDAPWRADPDFMQAGA